MTTLRRSLAFSFLDKYLSQAIMIGTTAIMARLLTPAETGLYLIAYSVIVFVETARDFGVGTYIIQKAELDQRALRTAFTLTMLLSAVLAGLLYLGANRLAGFYGEPAVATILKVSTLGLLVVPLGAPLQALMRRELAFSTLAWINIAAAACSSLATVCLAVMGVGAESYIWGFVLSNVAATILALAARRPDPAIYLPSLAKWREVATFGGTATLVALLNLGYDLLPRLLLGRLWGMDAVGIYARALTICQLPDRTIMGALQPVVLPAMAARARHGGDLKDAYLRGHALMSAVQWPVLAVLALLAMPVVRILLGEQWLATVPMIQVMAVGMMALAPAFMTYPLLVSAGRIRDALTSSLIGLPVAAAVVTVACHLGPQALAASMLLTAPGYMALAFWFIARAIGLRWQDMARASWASLATTSGAMLVPCIVVALSPTGFDLAPATTVVAVLGAGAGWLAGLFASGHPFSGEMVRIGRGLLSRVGQGRAA